MIVEHALSEFLSLHLHLAAEPLWQQVLLAHDIVEIPVSEAAGWRIRILNNDGGALRSLRRIDPLQWRRQVVSTALVKLNVMADSCSSYDCFRPQGLAAASACETASCPGVGDVCKASCAAPLRTRPELPLRGISSAEFVPPAHGKEVLTSNPPGDRSVGGKTQESFPNELRPIPVEYDEIPEAVLQLEDPREMKRVIQYSRRRLPCYRIEWH